MFNFFKKKKEDEIFSGWSEVFSEKTQVFYGLPSMNKIHKGFIPCSKCKTEISVADFEGLSMAPCPACGTSNFIPKHIKDYWLYSPLAVGSSSRVYKAIKEAGGGVLDVAVKLLPKEKEKDPESIKELLHEAEVGMLMGQHPHLVEVYEYNKDHDDYFMVTEFIDGVRLDDVINSSVKRPQSQVLLWAMQIMKGLHHMHKHHGYLYRALNTKNVMIDNDGNVKLVDYGLAIKQEDSEADNKEFIKGTIHYIPPERLKGEGEGEYSEVYSLGLLLYQMLTRERYFPGASFKEIAAKHMSPLRMENLSLKMPAGTPRELIEIIKRMIKYEPAERFPTLLDAGVHLMTVFDQVTEGKG